MFSIKTWSMKKFFLVLLISMVSVKGFSQQPDTSIKVLADTLIKKLDSLSVKKDSIQLNNTQEAAYNEQTKLTFKTYLILLGSTIKQEYTKPFHMKKREWAQLGLFTVAAGALSFADEPIQKQALKFRANNTGASKLSKYITSTGGAYEMITLAALGSYGYIFKNQKMRTTTLLATQAYITGTLIETTVKYLTGRTRPSTYGADVEAEPRFKGPFSKGSSNGSFPSGHATVAFAAATVYAMEYKSTVWVPILAYSAATLISASRITENKHWTTDVFVGAVLGYLNGRHVVNNYHRYAKIKAPGQQKSSVSFNLQYDFGQFRPGLVYHIR
jgi:membrane-associated phospholipid phosphatase